MVDAPLNWVCKSVATFGAAAAAFGIGITIPKTVAFSIDPTAVTCPSFRSTVYNVQLPLAVFAAQ